MSLSVGEGGGRFGANGWEQLYDIRDCEQSAFIPCWFTRLGFVVFIILFKSV